MVFTDTSTLPYVEHIRSRVFTLFSYQFDYQATLGNASSLARFFERSPYVLKSGADHLLL